jgi:hypothetical protein
VSIKTATQVRALTRRLHAEHHETTLDSGRVSFAMAIPSGATPDFATSAGTNPLACKEAADSAPDSQTSLVFAGIFPHPAATAVAYARCFLRRSVQATGKAESLSVALDLGPPTIGIARKEQVPGLQSKFAQYTDPGRDRFASSLACSSDISGTAVYCISGSARSGLPTYAVPVTGSAGAVAAAWSDWVAKYWLVWQAR